MNHKKLYRLYCEENLSMKRRRGSKRARGSRTPMPVALQTSERWSLDFVSDTFGASRKFRMLAVNNDCCRENLCLVADTSISGARVVLELDALVRVYGKPACIVSDNGTEFTSRQPPAEARRAPEQFEDTAHDHCTAFVCEANNERALAQSETTDYKNKTRKSSL